MKYNQFGNDWVIRLEKGDEILSTLSDFCLRMGIFLGTVQGIGATDRLRIGLFDPSENRYLTTDVSKNLEITALLGNISRLGDGVRLHLHITAADGEGHTWAGHLDHAFVSVTCEVFIRQIDGDVERVHDPDTGLYLLNL